MNFRTPFLRSLAMVFAPACCLSAIGAARPMTFEQAVEKATSLKGCPKQDRGSIEGVYLSDSEGNRRSANSNKAIFLVVQGAAARLPSDWSACRASDLQSTAGAPRAADVRHLRLAEHIHRTPTVARLPWLCDLNSTSAVPGSKQRTSFTSTRQAPKRKPRPADPHSTSSCPPPRLFYPASDASGLASFAASSSMPPNLQSLSYIKGATNGNTLEARRSSGLGGCIPRSCRSTKSGYARPRGKSPPMT